MNTGGGDAALSFEPHRRRLAQVAYRMLGSVADAEDAVQEAFLRWYGADRGTVTNAEAFLVRTVARISLDQLRSARRRRETYPGPWLPEPVVEAETDLAEDVTLPLLMALERLSPLERAAFLLHDVFGLDFDEVGDAIEREPAACRQLATRARQHVRAARPRFAVENNRGRELAQAFFTASRTGDIAGLRTLLAADITFVADGGGKRPAGSAPILGIEAVLELHTQLARLFARTPSRLLRFATINGLPGFVTIEPGDILQTTALQVEDGRIVAVYIVRNPDKLAHLARA